MAVAIAHDLRTVQREIVEKNCRRKPVQSSEEEDDPFRDELDFPPEAKLDLVTVITPTIPGREHLLARAKKSVQTQSFAASAHLIGVDHKREGPAAVRNRLAQKADTEFLAFLDDDDEIDSGHLMKLFANSLAADVVYSYCRVDPPGPWPHNREFDPKALVRGNFIPVTALVRTSVFHDADGFPLDMQFEDWGLWLRILAGEGRFVCVPEVTWTYHRGDWDRRSDHVG